MNRQKEHKSSEKILTENLSDLRDAMGLTQSQLAERVGVTLTEAMNTENFQADLNLDGKFDEQDCLRGRYGLFCLTSRVTFSCGNLVPSILKDSDAVTMLGKTSGGGACAVLPLTTAYGTQFRISGPFCMGYLRNGSFYDIDQGVEPHYRLPNYDSFYDREALTDYLHSLYYFAPQMDRSNAISQANGAAAGPAKAFSYHFADRDEAVACYLSNTAFFDGFSDREIQYRAQDVNGTLADCMEYGTAQMSAFTEEEKSLIRSLLTEMEQDLSEQAYQLPEIGEITFIKSSQLEEGGAEAYTHGTQVYFGQGILDNLKSGDAEVRLEAKCLMWHEIFHCLTRTNPQFRKDMYRIIHFTVAESDYELPPKVQDILISNPDVEHHDAYASFDIDGKMVDCYVAVIASKPFEKAGDSFIQVLEVILIPVDSSDTYYPISEAKNYWEVFGDNTGYAIDPEECMADNFSYAMTYGVEGKDYKTPEIITAILDYVR